MKNHYIPLKNRSVIIVSGKDAASFLQGLITNDINKVSDERAIYALMLTPQGKYIYDFFISKKDGKYFLDCSSEKQAEIVKKLSMYKLRSEVQLEDASNEYEVAALIGDSIFEHTNHEAGYALQFCKGLAYTDPRGEKLYARSIIEKENNYQSFIAKEFTLGSFAEYEKLRIQNCAPDGDLDLIANESFPLQNNMNELNAIDYKKGCYVGQEVTARTHHKGTVRKKLFTVKTNDKMPEYGSELKQSDRTIGKILSSCGDIAIAQIKTDQVDLQKNLESENATISIL